MSRQGSIFYRLLNSLKEQQSFGKSKYAVKKKAREEAIKNGLHGQDIFNAMNDAVFNAGIFSVQTYATYRNEVKRFADWCKSKGVKNKDFDKTKDMVSDYLSEKISLGQSAWSIKVARAALRKAYKDNNLANDIKIPERKLKDITRSRLERPDDKKINLDNYKDLIDFCKSSGLRRREVSAITANDIYKKNNRLYVHVKNGKGGKTREVPVLKKYQPKIESILEKAKDRGNERLFTRIPEHLDIHSMRREYAQERFIEIRGRKYKKHTRDKRDREAVREVSRNLGHNRENVTVSHYLS